MSADAVKPLVERVALAIANAAARSGSNSDVDAFDTLLVPPALLEHLYTPHAQAALNACHLQDVIALLNEQACWYEGDIVTSGFDEPGAAEAARKMLAKMGIQR